MTFSNDPAGSERSSVWSDARRRFSQKRYLLSWILAAILPLILLRLLFLPDVTFPFQSVAVSSPEISVHPETNVSHGKSSTLVSSRAPASENVKSNTTIPESPLIRPDEDAWITHDNWINHNLNRTQDGKIITAGFENSTELMKDFSPESTNGEDFGLPEDNEKEELQYESTEMTKKNENRTEENTSAEEPRTEEARPEVDHVQQEESTEDQKKGDEGEKQVEVNDENSQQDTSEEVEKIKAETKPPKLAEEEEKPAEQVDNEGGRPQHQREKHEEKRLPRPPKDEQKPKEQVDKEEDKPQQQRADQAETKLPQGEPKPVEQADKEDDRPQQQREEHGETLPKLPEEEQVRKDEDRPQENSGRTHEEMPTGACDLFEGEWEHAPEGPLYTNSTCSYIQQYQDCLANGRPDTEYLYWRWKPRGCDLPRFDPKLFLDKFRGKGISFIGDSIARNQMQSLLCMLSQVETPIRTYESEDYRTNFWLFEGHQFKLGIIWSPYLLKYSEDGGDLALGKDRFLVHLDTLDPAWTSMMQQFNFLIFSAGPWYPRWSVYLKQHEVVACHYCPELNLTEFSYYEAYRGAVRQVLEKVSGDGYKGVAVMNTFPVSHFESGSWDSGGHCERNLPLQAQESAKFSGEPNAMSKILFEEVDEIIKRKKEQRKNARVEIMDVTKVAIQRADGHPGRFGRPHWDPTEHKPNDCLHWCLPGPIDVWNEVLGRLLDKYV